MSREPKFLNPAATGCKFTVTLTTSETLSAFTGIADHPCLGLRHNPIVGILRDVYGAFGPIKIQDRVIASDEPPNDDFKIDAIKPTLLEQCRQNDRRTDRYETHVVQEKLLVILRYGQS